MSKHPADREVLDALERGGFIVPGGRGLVAGWVAEWPHDDAPDPVPSPEALDLRHAGDARLLTEAEIREIERERGRRL